MTERPEREDPERRKLAEEMKRAKGWRGFWASPPRLMPLITALIAVGGLLFSVHQFNEQQKQNTKDLITEKQAEFKQRFWEERLKLYEAVSAVAARIATAKSMDDVSDERWKFWEFYWGPLSIIEDRGVAAAMVKFGNELKRVQSVASPVSNLEQLSYRLAKACRKSLQETWEPVPLEELEDNIGSSGAGDTEG